MSEFIKKLGKIEDKYGVQVCIHEWIKGGKRRITLYRVIEKEEERRIPLPIKMQEEINILLQEEYSSFAGRILFFFIRRKISINSWFPFRIAILGMTTQEIQQEQDRWNSWCKLAWSCYD